MNLAVRSVRKKEPHHTGAPDPVDVYVGARLRTRRSLLGWSQDQLGKAAGLTFQQIQKYERGLNRMGASRLFHMAEILNVPVSWFFANMEEQPSRKAAGFAEQGQETIETPMTPDDSALHARETLELIRAWYRIKDSKQRKKFLDLIRSMADQEE